MSAPTARFILLPTRGFIADSPHTTVATARFLVDLGDGASGRAAPRSRERARNLGVRVIDSIHETGAKLVELSGDAMQALKKTQPGLRIVPEVFFEPARAPRPEVLSMATAAMVAVAVSRMTLKIAFAGTGAPVQGADVVAFTDWTERIGASGKTNAKGEVKLKLPATVKTLQRVYVYPADSGWPVLRKSYNVGATPIAVHPIDLDFVDSRAACYPKRRLTDGGGVMVGVIDTGVGPHSALVVAGGICTVAGEAPEDWLDADQHGTHVAGIIAGRGDGAFKAFRGLAPGVTLRAYRVFGHGADGASNFAIAKAIDRAVADGCDLLNLSLGGGPADPVTGEAIKAARASGTVCVIAAGNDGGAVSYPGRHDLAVCVSALGKKGTWPSHAAQADDVTTPTGKDGLFLAAFSNRGLQVDIAGPGLGIISSVPEGLFAVMDGTSMACPAVTGVLARRLANSKSTLAMHRDAERSDAIVRLILGSAVDTGLPSDYQGAGLAK